MLEPSRRVIENYVCTGCSLLCDDLRIEVENNQIVAVEPACSLLPPNGFGKSESLYECAFEGQPASFEEGVRRATDLLLAARSVAVCGISRATTEAQHIAVEIAERLRGYALPDSRERSGSAYLTHPYVGQVTETLGEVFRRCDAAVFWHLNPLVDCPRMLERMQRDPAVLVVEPTLASRRQFQHSWRPLPGSYPEILAVLRALARDVVLDPHRVEAATGEPLAQWSKLHSRIRAAKHPAFIYDSAATCVEVELLGRLVRELRVAGTPATVLKLEPAGNAAGAVQLLTWQTGFPACVSFARGYPEYLPYEATLEALIRERRVDAVLTIGADVVGRRDERDDSPLRELKSVVLDERLTPSMNAATASFGVARFGLETSGTVFRTDGVAMPVQAALVSKFATTTEVLGRLLEGIKQQ